MNWQGRQKTVADLHTRVCPHCNSFLQVIERIVDYPADEPPSCPICGARFLSADDGRKWDPLQERFYTSWRRCEYKIARVLKKGLTAAQIAELMERVSVSYDGLLTAVQRASVERHEPAVKRALAKMDRPAISQWSAIPDGVGSHIMCLTTGDYVARFSFADCELSSDDFEKLLTEDRRRQ